MAQDLGEAVLKLTTDTSSMKSGLAEAQNLLEDFLTIEAVKEVVALGKEMLDSFAEAQRAFVTLQFTTGKSADELHRWAEEMQNVTEFSHEQIETNIPLLAGMGMTKDRIKEVMTAAMNLSSVYGVSLDQAVRGLASSLENGTVGMLSRYIPTLRTFTKEQLENGAAIKWTADNYTNAAQTIGQSVAGIQTRMTHLIDEQKEKIGAQIAATYVSIMKFADIIEKIGDVAAQVVGILVKVLVANQLIIVDFWRFIVDGFKTMAGLLQNLWKDILHPDKWLKDAEDAFMKMVDHVKDYAIEFKDLFVSQPPTVKRVMKDIATAVHDSTVDINNSWHQVGTAVHDTTTDITNSMKKVEDFFLPQSDLRSGLHDTFEDAMSEQKAWASFVTQSFSSTFEAIGRGLEKHEASWTDVSTAALEAIAAIVKALGDQLAAMAAADIVKGFADLLKADFIGSAGAFGAAAIEGAGAAAAWIAAGAIKASVSAATGADFTVPPGYPNDSMGLRVSSGEHVSVTPAGQGGEMIHNTLVLDGAVLADWMTKASRNKRFLTTARSVVP